MIVKIKEIPTHKCLMHFLLPQDTQIVMSRQSCTLLCYKFHFQSLSLKMLVVLKTRTFRLATKLRQKFNRFSPFRKLTSFVTSFTAVIYAPNTDLRIFQFYKYLGAAKYLQPSITFWSKISSLENVRNRTLWMKIDVWPAEGASDSLWPAV